MTDDGERLSLSSRLVVTVILAAVALLMFADAAGDWESGGSPLHLAIELAVAALAALGVARLWMRYLQVRTRLSEAGGSIERARAEAEHWRARHADVLRGLSAAIDRQLDEWQLTPAEKEVAFLLLKGLTFKEVAAVRGAGERTVRQQALAVYAKAGLAGRAELAAFFLEDLLVPSLEVAVSAAPRA